MKNVLSLVILFGFVFIFGVGFFIHDRSQTILGRGGRDVLVCVCVGGRAEAVYDEPNGFLTALANLRLGVIHKA